jgi:hypothetical protein
MVIKPSGVGYDELVEGSIVVCDLDGVPVTGWTDGALRPSSDTASQRMFTGTCQGSAGGTHAFGVRDGLGGVRDAHTVRAYRDGR